jgi:hypothetical protein
VSNRISASIAALSLLIVVRLGAWLSVSAVPPPSGLPEAPQPPREASSPSPSASPPVFEVRATVDSGAIDIPSPPPSLQARLPPASAEVIASPEVIAAPLPSAAPRPDASEAPRSKPSRELDPRFGVRWNREGLCGDRRLEDLRAERERLLASFVRRSVGGVEMLGDPRVQFGTLVALADEVQAAHRLSQSWVDWSPAAAEPELVVYAQTQQLLANACVNGLAIGYYDGRLHISVDEGIEPGMVAQTVRHEYVHHVLNVLGVPSPMWLHEGLAMRIAEETWWRTTRYNLAGWLKNEHVPFEAMVTAFPHTADSKFALAAYYQSLRMVEFLAYRRGDLGVRALVRQLGSATTSPTDAFAVGAGLKGAELEAHWSLFVRAE